MMGTASFNAGAIQLVLAGYGMCQEPQTIIKSETLVREKLELVSGYILRLYGSFIPTHSNMVNFKNSILV